MYADIIFRNNTTTFCSVGHCQRLLYSSPVYCNTIMPLSIIASFAKFVISITPCHKLETLSNKVKSSKAQCILITSNKGTTIISNIRIDLARRYKGWVQYMMTSSNGNIFRVTGHLASQRPVTGSFDVFFDLRLNRRLSKTTVRLVIWDTIAPIMTSL